MRGQAVEVFRARASSLAAILAQAAREGADVGELLAAACRSSAASVGGVEVLLAGRPGSWEAGLVRDLAGGWEYEL